MDANHANGEKKTGICYFRVHLCSLALIRGLSGQTSVLCLRPLNKMGGEGFEPPTLSV